MPTVKIEASVPTMAPEQAFRRVIDYARYPKLVDSVQAVRVEPAQANGMVLSHWEVLFRNGILAWSEADSFDYERLVADFEQTEGDFDIFNGQWRARGQGRDSVVTFTAEFDFGVPSLACIIDPVAVRVLTENIDLIVRGLFQEVLG